MLNFETISDFLYRFIFESQTDLLKDDESILREIKKFKMSARRKMMFDGERYFEGKHDILSRERTIIGANGDLETVDNLPNNHIVDNQYAKLVKQKKNYLLGQPLMFKTENKQYSKELKAIFNMQFMRMAKNLLEDSLNEGVAWLYPGYDENGEFTFTKFKAHELIPFWHDSEHTKVDGAIHFYPVVQESKNNRKIIEKIELFAPDGIYRLILDEGRLYTDDIPFQPYFTMLNEGDDGKEIEEGYNWVKIPLIPFKYNSNETPLLNNVKSLQDGLNTILSNFQNNMEEDARNTILVLVNYDGEKLGEFRKNLATYGAVKVKSIDGTPGDLKTLQIEVNADNYKAIIEIFKKAIIENGMGYDAKDDRMSGNPNQMNIQSMYSDIDLDANEIETEYQAALEQLIWFVDVHLFNMGLGDFEHEDVEVVFNRDILINETEAIDNCNKSVDLSLRTRLSNHPWIDDVDAEIDLINKQEQDERDKADAYANAFNNPLINGKNKVRGDPYAEEKE